jgi:flagellar biosynthetic protein FliP
MTKWAKWLSFLMLTVAAQAQTSAGNGSWLTRNGGPSPLQVALFFTALAVLPAVLVSLTPFLRLMVVFHFLRQALGTQSTPSNQVLIGLALFLSLIVIQPVVTQVHEQAWVPMEAGTLSMEGAWEAAQPPIRDFLLRFAKEKELRLFLELTKTPPPQRPSDLKLNVVAPAYVLSELKAGFRIGVLLFLPFLMIDLLVAAITLSVGMVQLPPVMVSAPFKILLFVLVDGWNVLVGALMKGLLP